MTEDRGSIEREATRSEAGEFCPLCRFPIKERERIVVCGDCGAPHHADCWAAEDGCSQDNCSGGRSTTSDVRESTEAFGPHVPPRSGPTGKNRKKSRLKVAPVSRRASAPRRKDGLSTEPSSEATTGISRSLLTVGGIAVLAAVIGILLVSGSSNDDRGNECEERTGIDGIPCYDNGTLPNIPKGEMRREASRVVRNWYRTLAQEQFGDAWALMSERKRAQIQQNKSGRFPRGKQSWIEGQELFSRYLDPTGLQVDLIEPSYPMEGVLTVNIRQVPYTDPQDPCGFRSGITWIKFEPSQNMWYYEPGIDVTEQRARDWSARAGSIFKNSC